MKTLITLLFLLLSTISFAQIPSYVPTNGLVGWWPFNGNANDESGNGNNGTVNGATLTVDRNGNSNTAYYFSGLGCSTYIACNINTSSIINGVSIGFWVQRNGPGCISPRIMKFYAPSDGPGTHVFGWPNNSNNPSMAFVTSTILSPFYQYNNISNSTWAHIIFTNDGTTAKLYQDGLLISSHNSTGIVTLAGNANFGRMTNPANDAFNGSLDDIGIWNRALTECEIKDLYHAQLGYSTVDAGADQTICRGDMVTLQGAGGSSLAWDNGVIDGVPFEPAQSGAYVLTGADSLGCIGTDTVQVTVLENASSTINQTAIDSYTLNGQTYTQSGTYTQVVAAANGCDSVITLNLELDFTGIQSHTNTSLQLYPNPVKDVMTLVGLKGEAVSFAVYSIDGKLIKSGQTSWEIQLEDLKKGNYILKIENEVLPFVKL